MARFRGWRQAFNGPSGGGAQVTGQQSLYGMGASYPAGRWNRHIGDFSITMEQTLSL